MKCSAFAALRRVQHALCRIVLPVLLLLISGYANAQTVKAVINPSGGLTTTDDLKIEVLSDGGIKVTRKGLLESYIRTDSSQGMRAFFDFKNDKVTLQGANLKSPAICYISPVAGTGEYWDPYTVHIVGTIVDRYYSNGVGQTGTVTCILSYVKNTRHFLMDYILHMPNTSAFTRGLFYLSEQVVMGASASADPDVATTRAYGFLNADSTTIGMLRDNATAETPEAPRSHVYRTFKKFDSWEGSIPGHRFNINDNGFFPYNTVADGIDGNGRSMGVMRQLGGLYEDAFALAPYNLKTFRILSGYGTTKTEFDSVKAVKDSIPTTDFSPVRVKFSDAVLSGNEGSSADGEHVAAGLTLTVSGGKINAPVYVLLKYDAAYASNYTHPAVPGVDFTLNEEAFLIPAGDYRTEKKVTVTNLRIIGNDQLQYSRTLRLKLVATCSSLLSVSGTSEVDYTIIDDDSRAMSMTIDSASMLEGNFSKARITLAVGVTCPEPIVITFSRVATSTAGDTDYVVPASVTIPANQSSTGDFNIMAKADKALENTEKLILKFQGTILGITVAGQNELLIKDSTFFNPNYSKIYADCASPDEARPVREGYDGYLSLHLAPGVSTEVNITVDYAYVDYDNSTADDQDDFDLNSYSGDLFRIRPGQTSTLIPFRVFEDNLIEGPVPEVIVLDVAVTDDVGTGRVYTYAGPDIPILDMDYDPNMKVVLTATPSTIKEGDAGASVTVSLPGNKKSIYDIPVAISRGLSSTAVDLDLVGGATALPTSVTIKKNQNSIAFPSRVRAATDNILENDESLWIVTKPTGFVIDSSMITIQDATGDVAGIKDMKIELVSPTLKEGNNSGIKISFVNTTVTAGVPIAIALSHDLSSIASPTDYTVPATITLPAGNNNYIVNGAFTAVTDNILEGDEAVTLVGASGSMDGLTISGFSGLIQDATGDNPANKKITVTASHPEMDEGGVGYSFSFSLPTGITTEIPILITPELLTGSTASADDYTLATSPLTLSTGNSISTAVEITTDNIVEGDELLILGGTATAPVMTGFEVVPVSVTLKDKTAIAGLTVTTDRTEIVEGEEGAYITITLPDGFVPSIPITVNLTRGLSSEATSGYTGLPQTVLLSGNSITIPVPVAASIDNIIGDNDKLVVLVEAEGYPKDSIILQMIDVTANNPANTKITFAPQPASQGNHVLEGNTYTVRASFPEGILPAKPIALSVTASVLSEASPDDYSGVPVTLTIDPATGYKDFIITALTDNIIENSELLRITGATTSMPGISIDSLDIYIDDATSLDPAKATLQMILDSTEIHKGGFTKVTFGFSDPAVTTKIPITINVAPDPSSTADLTNYTGIPSVVTLPVDSNKVTFFLYVPNNYKLEGTTILQFTANSTTFNFATIAPLRILELTGAALTVVRGTDAAEPATDGSFIIKLPVVSTSNVVVSFNAVYSSTNIEPLPASVVIPAGATEITVPVKIKDDLIMQGHQTLRITLMKAVAENNGSPINLLVDISPALITVFDDESAETGPKALARQLLIEWVADAVQPSTSGAFRVRFRDSTLIASAPIKVNYSAGGVAQVETDYKPLPESVTIPAGKSTVMFDVTPSGLKNAGPNKILQVTLTSATANLPNIDLTLVPNPMASLMIYNHNIDTPTVNLFAATSQIIEGGEIEFVIRTTQAITVDLPVTIDVTNDIYRTLTLSGGTVTGNSIKVTVPAGLKEQTFKVKVNDNDISDDDGWVQVVVKEYNPASGTAPYYVGLASEVRNTVEDNDSLKLTFTANRFTIEVPFDEVGKPLPFTMYLNRLSSRIVTVYYEFYTPANSDLPAKTALAVGGKDYDNTVTPLLILPGQKDAEIPVLVNSVEQAKMFGMRLLRATVSSNQHVPVIDSVITANGIIEICMECDSDGDGVPDYVERFIKDGRWKDRNNGNVRVHPAVSPNNDGLGNDVMYIENIDKYPDNEVTIFNRWGGTVFTTKGYHNKTNNFSGKSNTGAGKNQDVPDGSYFFIVQTKDTSGKNQRYTGFIVIKR
jgi:gliding motility-associated-like protein